MRSGFSSGARDAPFQTFLAKGKLKRTWDMDSISLHLRHRYWHSSPGLSSPGLSKGSHLLQWGFCSFSIS
ncbi:unnamed protein product [Brassica oleracea var. botrytis]